MQITPTNTKWMDNYKDATTIPVGQPRTIGERDYTPADFIRLHTRKNNPTVEDVKALGEFQCKLIWVVNCRYGLIPDENFEDTYTKALMEVFEND